ncbi:MAG: cytochrome c oxidase subunit 3 family protein [Deltaproteobacteria bacterium]|nr:cytochrome c oxidase subunit 3 family protein [Deltaproteobacteria bacterium]
MGTNEHAGEHGEDHFLGHHFKDHAHQLNTAKLGIWLFLGQELLFFGGLFCAYAIYRSMHPEIFAEGHLFLDTRLGAINTCVLIFSSLTAAWSVRAAQLNNRRALITAILLTILCAFGFLGIKYVEYAHKIHEGLVWGASFAPSTEAVQHATEAMAHGASSTLSEVHGLSNRLHIFFSIYFAMTGLHGIHVIAGILVYFWLLRRAIRGDFTKDYYGPVDGVALYWHLVDLIWIYLFPLLYLIH